MSRLNRTTKACFPDQDVIAAGRGSTNAVAASEHYAPDLCYIKGLFRESLFLLSHLGSCSPRRIVVLSRRLRPQLQPACSTRGRHRRAVAEHDCIPRISACPPGIPKSYDWGTEPANRQAKRPVPRRVAVTVPYHCPSRLKSGRMMPSYYAERSTQAVCHSN